MPPRAADDQEKPETPPLSQKQEDLLLELFLQLSLADRREVIKLCRDLSRAAKKRER